MIRLQYRPPQLEIGELFASVLTTVTPHRPTSSEVGGSSTTITSVTTPMPQVDTGKASWRSTERTEVQDAPRKTYKAKGESSKD